VRVDAGSALVVGEVVPVAATKEAVSKSWCLIVWPEVANIEGSGTLPRKVMEFTEELPRRADNSYQG